jgi:hypothetical protein
VDCRSSNATQETRCESSSTNCARSPNGACAATDPADVDVLQRDLSAIAVEIAMLGYERHSGYGEFAPLQLAFESTRDSVKALRAKTLGLPAAHYGARTRALEPPPFRNAGRPSDCQRRERGSRVGPEEGATLGRR